MFILFFLFFNSINLCYIEEEKRRLGKCEVLGFFLFFLNLVLGLNYIMINCYVYGCLKEVIFNRDNINKR